MHSTQCGDVWLWYLIVVPMVVWIVLWACVDVLFHVLFNTRPPMVVSDECQCVLHTQITTNHSVVQFVHHASTLHLANHQQHHAFLHATHTSPSCFFHNCLSFFSMLSSSSSSSLRPLRECVVVMECITRLHKSSTRCACATLVPSSVAITLLWCFDCCACCSPHHCASHTPLLDSGCC